MATFYMHVLQTVLLTYNTSLIIDKEDIDKECQ